MTLKIQTPVAIPEEIGKAVNDLVTGSHQDDFREIGVWMVRTGLGKEGAREKLINELSARISQEISNGLLQVTLQQLEGEREIKAKYEQHMPALFPHVDFIVKSGAFDIWTTNYWFRVTSNVTLDNLAVTMKGKKITGIKSGIMQVFATIAYCGHDRENPSPFTLMKNRKIFDFDLKKVVTF